jgi:hypothetical protein
MLGGVTDGQIESFIDGVSRMDSSLLRMIVKVLLFLGSMVKPFMEWYKVVDKATLGLAGYILAAMFLFILYYYFKAMWFVCVWIYSFIFKSSVVKEATVGATANPISPTASSMIANLMTSVTTILGVNPFRYILGSITQSIAKTSVDSSVLQSSVENNMASTIEANMNQQANLEDF